MKPFKLFLAKNVQSWLEDNAKNIINIVEKTYLKFSDNIAKNPDSYFLRFPDSDNNRIIALPAHIDDDNPIAGIKWISSFPENINNGLNRASCALILNDRYTGYPIACVEGGQISSVRTAASATIGAKYLHKSRNIKQLAIVGAGVISLEILKSLIKTDFIIQNISVCDLDLNRANKFIKSIEDYNIPSKIQSIDEAIPSSDMIIFATSAVSPYIDQLDSFSHNPTVLHMSLRDLSPEIILNAYNFVDDIDHSVKANTSLHLAEKLIGNRDFIIDNVSSLIRNTALVKFDKPRIFSPFGMGILDLSIAREIMDNVKPAYETTEFNS